MKKITALFTLLLLVVSITYASTTLSFSGKSTLVGGNGRTIRKTEVTVDEKGIMVLAEDEKVTAEGDGIKVLIGKGTIASIIDDGSVFTLYVVKGEGAVLTTAGRSVRIYTPTTLTEMEAEGSLYVFSGESDEYIYNYTSSSVRTYDAVRGTYTTVESGKGLDFMTNKSVFENDRKEEEESVITEGGIKTAAPQAAVESIPRIPAPPVFSSVQGSLTTPDEPVITENERTLTTPEEPVVAVKESTISDEKSEVKTSSPAIRVTQTLVDIEDESGS